MVALREGAWGREGLLPHFSLLCDADPHLSRSRHHTFVTPDAGLVIYSPRGRFSHQPEA
jgi:hypothetical protein